MNKNGIIAYMFTACVCSDGNTNIYIMGVFSWLLPRPVQRMAGALILNTGRSWLIA